ncbi:hypothetical protein, partial [Paraburkholderia bryophila]|uniref:hypothetical protein n=1 Tax=Paraburkholderia bryophila TaxID=420952 RepID=UPI001ABEFDE4
FRFTADSGESASRLASSAHTYRLLIFKDRYAFTTAPAPCRQLHNYPALLRSASLHMQQRNEIMEIGSQAVNPLRAIFSEDEEAAR